MPTMKRRSGGRAPGSGLAGSVPVRKILTFLAGLRRAVRLDRSVVYTLGLSAGVLAPVVWFREWTDVLLVLMATGVMIVAELFNTALEALCDHLEPGENDRIAAVKDIAASASGVGFLIWAAVVFTQAVKVIAAVSA